MKVKPLLLLTTTLLLLLSGCEEKILPERISDRADDTVKLWNLSFWGIIIVGSFVFFLIFYAIIRYGIMRKKSIKNNYGKLELSRESTAGKTVEVLGIVLPMLIIIVLFVYTMFTQMRVNSFGDQSSNSVNVGVIARQWSWSFVYDYDANNSKASVYDVGDFNHEADLYIPIDTKVRLYLYSPDVIHSFWVPELLYKLDVIPGRENKFEFTAHKSGLFTGRCAELCGLYHTYMLFKLHVVSMEEYQEHLAHLKNIGHTGSLINKKELSGVGKSQY